MGRLRILLVTGALACAGAATLLQAQTLSVQDQQARLRAANREASAAAARSRQLEAAAAGARDEAAQARAKEAAAAARIQGAEAEIAAARARILIIDRLLAARRTRLAERQGPILRLIAALQSLGRRPAVLAIAQPGSTEDMVHVRAVLGTAMPVVEARTADVRAELERVRRLREGAVLAVKSLRDGRSRLEAERLALVRMEGEHRLRSRQLDRSAMVESDRAVALGERARDIVELMATMGTAAETRAELEALPGPLPRPAQPGQAGAPAASGSAAANRLPPYRLPVGGQLVSGLGELSATGVRSRGLTLATWPDAQLVAPAAGRVIFAGKFRDYGQIVILDHGQGWTSLITGLGRIQAKVGDTIDQGGPIGRAPGGDSPHVTVELRRRGRPVDLTPLLG